MVRDRQASTSASEDRGRFAPLLLVTACLVLALLAVNKWGAGTNADTVVTSLISLQRPTLFFWSQNRLAVVPSVLLSDIKDNYANLLLLLYFQTIFFFSLTLAVSWFVARRLFDRWKPLDLALSFSVMTAALLATLNPIGSYTFIVDSAQPYALSYLLLTIATFAFFYGKRGWLAVPISLLCLFWSVGVNNSIVVPGVFFAVIAAWFHDYVRAAIFASLCVAIFVTWYFTSTFYPPPPVSYYSLDLPHLAGNVMLAGASIVSVARLGGMALLTVLATVAIILQPHRARIVAVILCCGVFAILWWLVFAQDAWVIANKSHFRYFFPVLFCFGIAAGAAIAGWLLESSDQMKRVLVALLSVASIVYLFAWPRPVSEYPVFADVALQADFARANRIRYIAGDYWHVWPIVFLLLDKPDSAFGLPFRGEPTASKARKGIKADCRSGLPVKALCVGQALDVCIDDSRRITGQDWMGTDTACPGPCSIITLTRTPSGPCT